MSLGYRAVGWNRQKRRYDAVIGAGVLGYLALFIGLGAGVWPDATAETLILRGLGSAALGMLTIILSIGPLARLDRRFLVLLYNRRHLGVAMFTVALAHGAFSLVQFHALGDENPLVSLLISNTRVDSVAHFPFQQLGALALCWLFAMAATSHDYWLKTLTAPVWKDLHMGVYGAWALVILHVALGALQSVTHPVWAGLLGASVLWVVGLHLAAARAEAPLDQPTAASPAADGYLPVFAVASIPEGRARITCVSGDRVAIFRYDGKISAVSNACQHQNGPLGEGRILDGCIVCPWHGYQYRPEDGASPPPFTEKVPTFSVRVHEGQVWLHPTPHPAGTPLPPARIAEGDHAD